MTKVCVLNDTNKQSNKQIQTYEQKQTTSLTRKKKKKKKHNKIVDSRDRKRMLRM